MQCILGILNQIDTFMMLFSSPEPDPLMEYKQGTKIKKSCFIITIILVKNQIAINEKTVT